MRAGTPSIPDYLSPSQIHSSLCLRVVCCAQGRHIEQATGAARPGRKEESGRRGGNSLEGKSGDSGTGGLRDRLWLAALLPHRRSLMGTTCAFPLYCMKGVKGLEKQEGMSWKRRTFRSPEESYA